MADEISDSLIQEVAACQEMQSQWSEMTAQTEGSTADQSHGAEVASAAEESLVPIAESRPLTMIYTSYRSHYDN